VRAARWRKFSRAPSLLSLIGVSLILTIRPPTICAVLFAALAATPVFSAPFTNRLDGHGLSVTIREQ
jgi:hypothetical protein